MAERIARQPRIFAGMERQGGKSAETGALPRSQPATVPDEPQSERVRIMQNFSVSCLSASLAHFPHHPLYTLKTQMMNKGKIFHFGSFCRTALESRGAFLMRGVMVRSVGIAPEKALKMLAWDGGISFMNYTCPTCPNSMKWIFGGTMAGAATTIIGCPSERTMVLAQTRGTTFREILRSHGVRALYHGARATLYRDISFNACLFTTRNIMMKHYEDIIGAEPSPYKKVLFGMPASVLAGVVACPFDVVKTRIQAKIQNESVVKKPLAYMREIVRTEGVRYLFKGLLPRLVAVPLYMSVFITVNEELQKYILGRRIVT